MRLRVPPLFGTSLHKKKKWQELKFLESSRRAITNKLRRVMWTGTLLTCASGNWKLLRGTTHSNSLNKTTKKATHLVGHRCVTPFHAPRSWKSRKVHWSSLSASKEISGRNGLMKFVSKSTMGIELKLINYYVEACFSLIHVAIVQAVVNNHSTRSILQSPWHGVDRHPPQQLCCACCLHPLCQGLFAPLSDFIHVAAAWATRKKLKMLGTIKSIIDTTNLDSSHTPQCAIIISLRFRQRLTKNNVWEFSIEGIISSFPLITYYLDLTACFDDFKICIIFKRT